MGEVRSALLQICDAFERRLGAVFPLPDVEPNRVAFPEGARIEIDLGSLLIAHVVGYKACCSAVIVAVIVILCAILIPSFEVRDAALSSSSAWLVARIRSPGGHGRRSRCVGRVGNAADRNKVATESALLAGEGDLVEAVGHRRDHVLGGDHTSKTEVELFP